MNLQEAEQLKNLERNGLKVGFVSYTAIIPDPSWEAKADSPGIAPLRPKYHDHILAHLNKSDKECDILIVLLHWGMEHSDQIEEWQQELARKMIEHGADAIIGHHPHVLRGIEFYQNRPILYSIGNFVFLKRDDKAGRTAIFKLQLNLGGFVSGSIQPVHIQYGKANLLSPSSQMSKQIIADMKQLSETVGTVFNDAGQFYPFP
jgi:poly-gamma-glutamate synthesis protein (capsule biosynthesis protein)